MLQQTQVATVIPYYYRFLNAFPSVNHLAAARLERVLERWSGLGYYRRARLLHLAAQKIVNEFGGRLPEQYDQLRALPGVGDYTARAILSIAYQRPYIAIDGNVARVTARLAGIKGSVDEPAFRSSIKQELEGLLSPRRPGAFNQAIMEVGQTICLPAIPRCLCCPLQRWCHARSSGTPEAYPQPRARRATEVRYLAAAVIHKTRPVESEGPFWRRSSQGEALPEAKMNGQDRVALIRGLDEGLLGDLWNFPAAFGTSRGHAFTRLEEKLGAVGLTPLEWHSYDVRFKVPASLARLHHVITYRSIAVDIYAAKTASRRAQRPLRWLPFHSLDSAAVSQLTRKIANLLKARRYPAAGRRDPSQSNIHGASASEAILSKTSLAFR